MRRVLSLEKFFDENFEEIFEYLRNERKMNRNGYYMHVIITRLDDYRIAKANRNVISTKKCEESYRNATLVIHIIEKSGRIRLRVF